MEKSIIKAIEDRRSFYSIGENSPISDMEIERLLEVAITFTPSPFNSQSARYVLLLGNAHKAFWGIVKSALEKIVPPESFGKTEGKINRSFLAGYGTVLFYEDHSVVKELQAKFPTYADNFPVWSEHSSGMNQFAVWMLLEAAGLGASLQHYNPLIDEEVRKKWNINPEWKLIAQMPFGAPLAHPG
ncbi:nitroreductase family protein, partial [Bacteroidales bacterium OttesenSCG-928-E04]|nr:nitroreductase family protein [Bacteroidales bacterium OttesenSCG-928-E04]